MLVVATGKFCTSCRIVLYFRNGQVKLSVNFAVGSVMHDAPSTFHCYILDTTVNPLLLETIMRIAILDTMDHELLVLPFFTCQC